MTTEPFWSKSVIAVLVFSLLYTGGAVVASLAAGNSEFMFYIVVMAVLAAAVGLVHYRVRLTTACLWCLSIWGLLHMAGGLVPVPEDWPINGEQRVLYSLWLVPGYLKYDHIVHAFGFGVTTWVCWQGLRAIVKPQPLQPTFGVLLLCVAAGMGFGATNEIVEFIAVLLIPNTNVGGYINTGWDLVANMVGAATAALLIRLGNHH